MASSGQDQFTLETNMLSLPNMALITGTLRRAWYLGGEKTSSFRILPRFLPNVVALI